MSRFLFWFRLADLQVHQAKDARGRHHVTKTNARATRTAEDLKKFKHLFVQHEACPADIHNQRGAAPRVDLLPQIADVDVDDIGLEREMVYATHPERIARVITWPGCPQEVFESLNSPGKRSSRCRHDGTVLFDQSIRDAHPQLRGADIIKPAQQRLRPARPAPHREGFGEIVVPSRFRPWTFSSIEDNAEITRTGTLTPSFASTYNVVRLSSPNTIRSMIIMAASPTAQHPRLWRWKAVRTR